MNKADLKTLTGRWLPIAVLFSYGTPAMAMGLGNIDVLSGLGQPLSAQIEIHDAPRQLDTGCFRLLHSQNDLPFSPLSAGFRLQQNPDGRTLLNISSYQSLQEPIVLLQLVADCENQISREYTLLLDPPLSTSSADAVPPAEKNVVRNIPQTPATSTSRLPVASAVTATTQATGDGTRAQAGRRVAPRKESPTKADARPVNAVPASRDTAPSVSDRLVISGDNYVRPEFFDQPLQLQMSLELSEWPQEEVASLNEEAAFDEMTAMANRLAYLESQIQTLQQRNAELETQRMAAKDDSQGSWLRYLLVTLCLMAALGLAEWLRRRHIKRRTAAEQAIWNELVPQADRHTLESSTPVDGDIQPTPHADTVPASDRHDFLTVSPALHVPHHVHAGTTVNEDILEQAEVFVAHGRANLAIVLLQDHLTEFPDLSPEPWLMLLDLLKRDGQRDAYNSAGLECRRHFNVAIPDFDAPLYEDNSSIENYPHIIQQLQEVWGKPEALPYLDNLIYNRRREARQGFGRNAYLEILLLRSLASILSPAAERNADHQALVPRREETPEIPPASEDSKHEPLFFEGFTFSTLPEDKSQPLEFELPPEKQKVITAGS